jgi:peroxiredoxin
VHDPNELPENLPVPEDDGGADHLPGAAIPALALPATDGSRIDLAARRGTTIVYAYPRTGVPGEDPLVPDWDSIPGARGCTPESCGFRDLRSEIEAAGASVVGLSTQDTAYQREAAERLRLGFPLISDQRLELASALGLPVFEVAGETLLRRLTMSVADGVIERVWYPVFPPDRHASEVLAWLRAR